MTSLRAGSVAAICALALAGCGEDREGDVKVEGGTDTAGSATGTSAETTPTSTEPASAPTGKPVETITVRETEFALAPANPKITKLGLVEFIVKNDGKIDHALEVEGPEGEAETGTIAPGATAKLKVDLSKAGTYEWYCPIGNHKDEGMEGTITVGKSETGGGAAAPDDDSGKSDDDAGGGAQAPY